MKVLFHAWGDRLITAFHKTTMEITKHEVKSKRGDCIIATRSEMALKDIPMEFKERAKDDRANIGLKIEVEGASEEVWGRGHPKLSFKSESDMVIRKSGFVCDRTLMVYANKAAFDLNRELVRLLKNPDTRIKLTLIVE